MPIELSIAKDELGGRLDRRVNLLNVQVATVGYFTAQNNRVVWAIGRSTVVRGIRDLGTGKKAQGEGVQEDERTKG